MWITSRSSSSRPATSAPSSNAALIDGITVRRPSFDLTALPRVWVGRSRLGTWFGNAAHVFIPLGERMFIDSVKVFRDQLSDPDHRRDVAAFIGQEAVHARVHEVIWDELRTQGVPVDAYAGFIECLRGGLEPRVPPALLLATTAALEHYTAAFGRGFLTEDLSGVLPEQMAALLAWHGAEELEHRSVAFDVLAEVDDGFGLRVAGMAMATALLTVVPGVGVGLFALVDSVRRPAALLGLRPPDPALVGMTTRFLRGVAADVVRYLQPTFHPGDEPDPPGYHDWLATQPA